ncbi:MAG: hypothetical protein JNN30_14695 [Rhodanobacteraceae bacterium]|nr:hypothetical protein [Rhodanobacteraceae bacterium]
MNAAARRHSTFLLTALAFAAALLPLAAATLYFFNRERQLANEVSALESRLRELDAELAPIGHLEQLRGQMLSRKQVTEVLQQRQHGLHAALALTTQIPANARLVALDVDDTRLSLQLTNADAETAAKTLEQMTRAGFSEAAPITPDAAGNITLGARIDPARFPAATRAEATQ